MTLHLNDVDRAAFIQALAPGGAHFTPAQREAASLVYLERLSLRAAAVRLGVPIGTLVDRVKSARIRLRQWWLRTHPEQVANSHLP